MSEIDLKKQIGNLLALQAVDSDIYMLNREKSAKPEEIKALQAEFEAKKQGLVDLEKKSLDLQKLKKDRELELSAKEEGTKKLQSQLYQLKTNKEYHAMLQQIEDSKADASVIEDKILEVMDQAEKLVTDVEAEKAKVKEEEKVLEAKKKVIQDRIKEIDEKLTQLQARRAQLVPLVDSKVLSGYERILANRDGLAIAAVKNFSCGGCNMSLPPQVVNLIKMYERLITCETCNRILCIGDESGS